MIQIHRSEFVLQIWTLGRSEIQLVFPVSQYTCIWVEVRGRKSIVWPALTILTTSSNHFQVFFLLGVVLHTENESLRWLWHIGETWSLGLYLESVKISPDEIWCLSPIMPLMWHKQRNTKREASWLSVCTCSSESVTFSMREWVPSVRLSMVAATGSALRLQQQTPQAFSGLRLQTSQADKHFRDPFASYFEKATYHHNCLDD